MIGRLRGEVVYKRPPQLLLEVGGVGYELEAPMSTFYDLPEVGGTVVLFTHLAVREDAQVLYGFVREQERALFRNLLKVSGVGARMALAILSGMDAQRFALCVQQEDVPALVRLPGIGKKTAQRLVIEMRDRLETDPAGAPIKGGQAPHAGTDAALTDAVSALVALGYRPVDANHMARAVDDGAKTSEEIIRAALKAVSAS
ncbi:MAG: Holliday junction branch migration protein RuvA [Chromatiaceae bacterium]